MKTPYDTVTAPGKATNPFTKGGLHQSTGTPLGKKIPAAKRLAALKGKLGAKAKTGRK